VPEIAARCTARRAVSRPPNTQFRSTRNRAAPPRALAAATVTDSCSADGSSTTTPSTSSTAEPYPA
jgi:hypothetical protein